MRLGQRWSFNTDFQWNEDRQEFDEGSLSYAIKKTTITCSM